MRRSLDAPVAQARYWASSDLEASPQRLLSHIATRWDIEVLFGDSKEELGLDHYQLMSALAIVRLPSVGDAGLCLSRGRTHAPTSTVARPSHHWGV